MILSETLSIIDGKAFISTRLFPQDVAINHGVGINLLSSYSIYSTGDLTSWEVEMEEKVKACSCFVLTVLVGPLLSITPAASAHRQLFSLDSETVVSVARSTLLLSC